MSTDPFSRPSMQDLREVLESLDQPDVKNLRMSERLELSVPAEIKTARGNTIAAMTREISRTGIGLFHKGSVTPGAATIRMTSETREFEYQVLLEWCHPCDNGMFMSGGRFVTSDSDKM